MSDLESYRQQFAIGRRIGQTEVKEVPIPDIGAHVYHNANQSITTATNTGLNFNSERFDTDAMHDTATNNSRLTCTRTGKHIATASVAFATNSTGQRQVGLRLNGTTYCAIANQDATAGGLDTNMTITSPVLSLTAGDYVEVIVYQNSGGNLNVLGAGDYSPEFSLMRTV